MTLDGTTSSRHKGHSFFVESHSCMHAQQKIWPQGVQLEEVLVSKHSEQRSDGSEHEVEVAVCTEALLKSLVQI